MGIGNRAYDKKNDGAIIEEKVDYSNKFSDAGEKLGTSIQKILTEGISGVWEAIKVLFF